VPLVPAEYAALAAWLVETELRPSDLIAVGGTVNLREYEALETDRLRRLVERGAQMALQVESWSQKGIWVISRSDASYPRRWKQRLGQAAPPLIYGVGPMARLNSGGVAIVGARKADRAALIYAERLARSCAASGLDVISGGALGVDAAAMQAAVACEGSTVGVLAQNLERTMLEPWWRDAIVRGNLVLLSVDGPRARFRAATALARNKLIYTLADHAVVVSAEHGGGGTWTGAVENMRGGWVPLFVRPGAEEPAGDTPAGDVPSSAVPSGNRALLAHGVPALPDSALSEQGDLGTWLRAHAIQPTPARDSHSDTQARQGTLALSAPAEPGSTDEAHSGDAYSGDSDSGDATLAAAPSDLFPVVWPVLATSLERHRTAEYVARQHDLRPAQARAWLERAVSEGLAVRRGRPARYRRAEGGAPLFP